MAARHPRPRRRRRHPPGHRLHARRCGRCWTRTATTRGCGWCVYTLDEDTFTRELAPLAGGYAAVFLGAPWWFLDSPEVLRRFREAVTETAGFYNTAGFVDDTRAFCSIPVRHDVARRVDAGFLARLVAEHRLPLDEAAETIVDLAYHLPQAGFRDWTRTEPMTTTITARRRPRRPVPDRGRGRRLGRHQPGRLLGDLRASCAPTRRT